MEDETISAYLTELGAKDGSYGGGSTAAYMGAMSASLVRKVIDIQKDKSRYLENENEMKELLKESEYIMKRFETLAKSDTVAFEPVLKAYKLPNETSEDKYTRKDAIERALQGATQPPQDIIEEGLKLIRMLKKLIAFRMKGTIMNDLMVATLIMDSVLEAAVLNITINTKMMKDKTVKSQLDKEAKKAWPREKSN